LNKPTSKNQKKIIPKGTVTNRKKKNKIIIIIIIIINTCIQKEEKNQVNFIRKFNQTKSV